MTKMDSMTKLEKRFPTLTVKNKTGFAQYVDYANGDRAIIQPGATRPIQTAGLAGIPSSATFIIVSPSLDEMKKAGIELFGKPKNDQPEAAKEEKPTKSSPRETTINNQSKS